MVNKISLTTRFVNSNLVVNVVGDFYFLLSPRYNASNPDRYYAVSEFVNKTLFSKESLSNLPVDSTIALTRKAHQRLRKHNQLRKDRLISMTNRPISLEDLFMKGVSFSFESKSSQEQHTALNYNDFMSIMGLIRLHGKTLDDFYIFSNDVKLIKHIIRQYIKQMRG